MASVGASRFQMQRVSQCSQEEFSRRCSLTWQSLDYAVHIAVKGTDKRAVGRAHSLTTAVASQSAEDSVCLLGPLSSLVEARWLREGGLQKGREDQSGCKKEDETQCQRRCQYCICPGIAQGTEQVAGTGSCSDQKFRLTLILYSVGRATAPA